MRWRFQQSSNRAARLACNPRAPSPRRSQGCGQAQMRFPSDFPSGVVEHSLEILFVIAKQFARVNLAVAECLRKRFTKPPNRGDRYSGDFVCACDVRDDWKLVAWI